MKYRFLILTILFYISNAKVFSQNMGIKLPSATLPNTTLDVNGAVSYREGTPLSIVNGTNNNVTLDSMSFYRITAPTAIFTITGFTNGQNGRLLFLINATSYTMTLSNQTGSSATNQINTGEGTDLRIAANGSVTLIYNSTLQKWVVWSKSGEQTDWRLLGNSGTTAGTHFIGTTDGQDFVLKSNNIERARLTNSNGGGFDVAQHLAVGADAGAMTVYQTAHIAENYSGIPIETSRGLWVEQVRTEATPTAGSIMAGIEANATYRMSGNATNGIGAGVKGTVESDGNYGFNSIMGGDFEARTYANSGTQRQMIGAYGLASNDGSGTITEATGVYADVTMSGTGTITEAAGLKGWAFLNTTGNMTTAIGIRGGTAKDVTATGTITTGIGIYADSYNALTNYGLQANAYTSLNGTYTNTYGGAFGVYANHASSIMTNSYGIRSEVYKALGTMNNNYAGYFSATGGATTNYGVYSTSGNTATNNYLYYGSVTGGVNTDWGLYINGEDKNYFSGNVGIGTTTPARKLTVSRSASSNDTDDDIQIQSYGTYRAPAFLMTSGRGTESVPSNLANGDTLGGIYFKGYANSAERSLGAITNIYTGDGTTTRSMMAFNTSGSGTANEKMRIMADGEVGIGTTSPEAALHVASNNGSLYNDMIIAGHSDIDDMPVINMRRSRGTMTSPTNLTNGSSIGGIHYYGYVNSGWNYLSSVNAYYKGNGTTNLSNLSFYTSNAEQMVIDENGRVGIGCSSPQYDLHVIGTLGVSTSIRTPLTSTGATTACSDIRYKKNIHPLSNALEKVLKIQGVTYDWRVNEFPDWKFSSKNQIGVIAQEIEKIYPELVETDEKGYKSVDYSKITPILVEAVKEQQAQIEHLKKKNQQTQNELEVLKKQMTQFAIQLEAMAKKQN